MTSWQWNVLSSYLRINYTSAPISQDHIQTPKNSSVLETASEQNGWKNYAHNEEPLRLFLHYGFVVLTTPHL